MQRKTLGLFLSLLYLLTPALAAGGSLESDKKQIAFINRTMNKRVTTIRDQLRGGKLTLATKNIRGLTESLRDIARMTKGIRQREPGYSPNPPAGCSPGPATLRRQEYTQAKKLALKAGKQLNRDYQAASDALLKARKRQIATIAISALKFTVENAPGRQGGKVVDLGVEGIKKLNGFLLDTYVAKPIAGINEVDLLKGNFIKIRDGQKLLRHLDKSRRQVIDLARELNSKAKTLDAAVSAEKDWTKYAWLCAKGARTFKVQVLDLRARDLELTLAGRKLGPDSKGQTMVIDAEAILSARVKDKRRKFCVDRKEYAKRTKSIIVHPGPGGGPEDSLVYSSSRIPAKSSWKIQSEKFKWAPSFNSNISDAPRAVSGAYWKREKARVRWQIKAKPGEQVNLKVDGKIAWRFESNIRGKRKKKDETNDGSATLVLKVIR